MADDDKRPFRAKEPYGRPTAGAAASNDPLAELARLIGQTDPFSEFGDRGSPRRAPAPSVPLTARDMRPTGQPNYGADPLEAQYQPALQPSLPYGASQYPPGSDVYRAGFDPAAPDPSQPSGAYDATAYYQDTASAQGNEDIYDDEPPRRRISVLAIAGIFVLAVLGTAGAFGYRALFGSSGSTPPPVIKADATPTKIVASPSGEPQSNKLITDRLGDRGQGEKLVSREEQPIDLKDRPPQSVFPGAPNANASPAAAATTGIIGEPKKVRTIAIRPDQPFGTPAAAAAAPTPPGKSGAIARAAAPAASAEAEEARPPVRQIPIRQTPPPANAPLSLNPDKESAPARVAPAPARTASAPAARSAPAAAASSGGPGSYVQVSSQRSEADAQTSFRALQGKFPAQLGSRQAVIRRADLGSKGTYYRAMVGPFTSASEAGELCSSLKSAGGQCVVQKN
ncbi:MAG: SPOR domain-containing protein [Pseudolabrys sp.]